MCVALSLCRFDCDSELTSNMCIVLAYQYVLVNTFVFTADLFVKM